MTITRPAYQGTLFAGSREAFNSALSYETKRAMFAAANLTAQDLPYQGFTSLVVLVGLVGANSEARVTRWFAPADAARTVSDHEAPYYFSWGRDETGDYCYVAERGE